MNVYISIYTHTWLYIYALCSWFSYFGWTRWNPYETYELVLGIGQFQLTLWVHDLQSFFRRSKEYSILVLDVSVHGKYHQDPLRKLLGKGCFESNSIANVEVYCGRFIYEFLHVCNPILLCQLCNHKTMHGFFVWVHCEPTGHSGSTLQCPEEAMPNGSEPSDHIPVFVSWSKHA